MSEFSYRLSYRATAAKPYGSRPSELLNTSNVNVESERRQLRGIEAF